MTWSKAANGNADAILIVDGDVITRHGISSYLRDCGYSVVEVANVDEAIFALEQPLMTIDIILCDMAASGTKSGFELARWVRQNRPGLVVRLCGSTANAAQTAAQLCETGPHLARPYEPRTIVDYIKRLRLLGERAELA